jgi:uncharacterized glyoxalase superfamily protein PhnB
LIEFKGVREPLRIMYLEPELAQVINLASVWSARHGVLVRITSLNDHKHAKKSLHYEDKAADFQVRDPVTKKLSKEGMGGLAQFFKQNLGLGWDVVWDSPGHEWHIHCEWDIRQRQRDEA